jgi:hypothetical protein
VRGAHCRTPLSADWESVAASKAEIDASVGTALAHFNAMKASHKELEN